ncbi:hypothetical protein P4O66_013639 [Electrophorus voltai]|uniref:Pyridine nucleotide-disulfide oxidoreductase domain-containing protein 2 n=1 Tax=Electrophorus voltai TaxID=2609070 RepID=A0AAD8Z238_9TELE|nr:hypothetical protein P4O66_013639 [Electrophorus voltai]
MREDLGGRKPPRSLLLGSDMAKNQQEIGKFSERDAKAFPDYVTHLEKLACAVQPLLDAPPVDIPGITQGSLRKRITALKSLKPLIKFGLKLGKNAPDFYELITSPSIKVLNRWFESEPLRATLATDSVIGANISPSHLGSGYVLLHHVMGEVEQERGAWGYVEGGMGGVSQAIASSARSLGADIFTEQEVGQVLIGPDRSAIGVVLKDGTEVRSKVVLSNATPHVTFKELTPQVIAKNLPVLTTAARWCGLQRKTVTQSAPMAIPQAIQSDPVPVPGVRDAARPGPFTVPSMRDAIQPDPVTVPSVEDTAWPVPRSVPLAKHLDMSDLPPLIPKDLPDPLLAATAAPLYLPDLPLNTRAALLDLPDPLLNAAAVLPGTLDSSLVSSMSSDLPPDLQASCSLPVPPRPVSPVPCGPPVLPTPAVLLFLPSPLPSFVFAPVVLTVPVPIPDALPQKFITAINHIDYTSPVTKINVAVDKLPNFLAAPNTADGKPGPHHQCSIHLNCENLDVLETAYSEGQQGHPSSRPMIEMTIPSVLDPTLAPPGCHVVSLFTQFTPYWLEGGRAWTDEDRENFANSVFDSAESYAPGFKASIVGKDILVPPDLERVFGLTGGNIFHGTMSLDQLYLARPLPSIANYCSPVKGLYMCGSGSHPGGGVMGSAGWNAAMTVLADLKRR